MGLTLVRTVSEINRKAEQRRDKLLAISFTALFVNVHAIWIESSSAMFAGHQLAQVRHPIGLRCRCLIDHQISRRRVLYVYNFRFLWFLPPARR